MSPVVLRNNNLKVFIYTNDHGVPHVHIVDAGARAKIFLETLEIESSKGFSKKALGKILKILKNDQKELIEIWEKYHGSKK